MELSNGCVYICKAFDLIDHNFLLEIAYDTNEFFLSVWYIDVFSEPGKFKTPQKIKLKAYILSEKIVNYSKFFVRGMELECVNRDVILVASRSN